MQFILLDFARNQKSRLVRGSKISMRNVRRVAGRDGGEFAFAQVIIDATPADGVAAKLASQIAKAIASHSGISGIFFHRAGLLHSPDANEPSHNDAQE